MNKHLLLRGCLFGKLEQWALNIKSFQMKSFSLVGSIKKKKNSDFIACGALSCWKLPTAILPLQLNDRNMSSSGSQDLKKKKKINSLHGKNQHPTSLNINTDLSALVTRKPTEVWITCCLSQTIPSKKQLMDILQRPNTSGSFSVFFFFFMKSIIV